MRTDLSIALLSLALVSTQPAPAPAEEGPPPLEVALEAGRWIESVAVATDAGTAWPADPARSPDIYRSLYSGTSGVVLFYLDLFRVTGDERWRQAALAGARDLAASLPEPDRQAGAGLYTGLAGNCFTLHRAGEVAGSPELADAARRCIADLMARARPAGAGIEWSEVTDIIGGTAGIGLTLLWAHEAMGTEAALEVATAAGDRLLEQAIDTDSGAKWAMSSEFPRLMPNFSHGTAGIAYYLARLHAATGHARFLEGALAGGRYLQEVAVTDGEICLVFHHEPEGEELFYLSWCHGPAGTGRTFWELYRATGDEQWLEWTRRSAAAVVASGIPEHRTPGFWENVSRCCGNAGVVEFFLDLYEQLGDPAYLEFAEHMADDLVARATHDESGMRWVQAEHRVQPENLAAQTGYMQGASGIGSMFLRLHAVKTGAPAPVVLPDSPFGR